MNTSKIFVVSAQDIFRTGVIAIARHEPTLEVVGDSASLLNAMQSITANAPDLIILDLHACDLTQDLPKLLHDGHLSASKTIAITSASTDYELTQCIQNRVSGIICRNVARSEMIATVRKVLAGRTHFCSHTTAKLKKTGNSYSLTRRELEVLQFLALGLPNKEIAERLAVAIGTIKTHLININAKLNVATRTEAVIRGIQLRLISI